MPSISTDDSNDSFSGILDPKLKTNTYAFLKVYREGVTDTEASERIDALTRFLVKSITCNKLTDTTYEHELISVMVQDIVTKRDHIFYIERNANGPAVDVLVGGSAPSTPAPAAASLSTPSISLVSAATSLSTAALAALDSAGQTKPTSDPDSHIPLLTDSEPLSSPYPPAPSLLPPPSRTLSRRPSHHSIQDIVTLYSARMINSSSSINSVEAEDRISGSGRFSDQGNGGGNGRVVREVAPVGLSLFDMGILADVIHKEAPSYNVLQNQCYWFTLMIFEIILRVFENTLDSQKGVSPDKYLPKLSGKCAGLLIIAPSKEDLDRVEKKFRERQAEEFSKVLKFVLLILIYLYLTSI
jgi:hypothetical protein